MTPQSRPSQESAILERLMQTPGEWVPMPELYRISGSLNVHTRIDNLRRRHGHKIENRTEPAGNGTRNILSYYRMEESSDHPQ